MTQSRKYIALLFFVTALASAILLSASLSNLRLQDGMPFPGGGNHEDTTQPTTAIATGQNVSFTLLKGIIDLILLILVLSVPARLIPLINMKRLVQGLLVVIALLLIVNTISHVPGSQPVVAPGTPSGVTPAYADYPVSSLGRPPQELIGLVLLGVLVGVGALIIKILKESQAPVRVEDRLSQEAESAIDAIKGGENFRGVITRCYLQMARALQEEQNIERSENMTVREFEDWLALKGFPGLPVHQLSRLYEKVRYGQQEILAEDERIAIRSLNEIILFCRGNGNQLNE
jgi:hypothetical protein